MVCSTFHYAFVSRSLIRPHPTYIYPMFPLDPRTPFLHSPCLVAYMLFVTIPCVPNFFPFVLCVAPVCVCHMSSLPFVSLDLVVLCLFLSLLFPMASLLVLLLGLCLLSVDPSCPDAVRHLCGGTAPVSLIFSFESLLLLTSLHVLHRSITISTHWPNPLVKMFGDHYHFYLCASDVCSLCLIPHHVVSRS